MVTLVKSSLAFCSYDFFRVSACALTQYVSGNHPHSPEMSLLPSQVFPGVAALGDVAARIYMGFS